MILRFTTNNSIIFILFIVCVEYGTETVAMTNTGSDKSEQIPTIIHFSQRSVNRNNNDDKNHENVSIIQSDSYAKSVHQVHDFIMQHKKRGSQVSSASNNDGTSLLVSDNMKNEQQVSTKKSENNESGAVDGLNGASPQLPLSVVTRGRSSKLFKSYKTIFDEAGSVPIYKAEATTTMPLLTTTDNSIATTASPEQYDIEEEKRIDNEEDDNNSNNEKINPFLISAFNFITSGVLSAMKSRQSNPIDVENKVEELNKGRDDNESELMDAISTESNIATESTTKDSALVEQGRYIKGDPLNGYYDFVITEGSYKFWIVFQLLTAALIIYSTFAAIYYSKVNPIVSDYEYQDYLGGRSFPEGASVVDENQDSVDPGDDGSSDVGNASQSSSWLASPWLQRTQYALQFILDAIEKPPK